MIFLENNEHIVIDHITSGKDWIGIFYHNKREKVMANVKQKVILECLQCGGVFVNDELIDHKCERLNNKIEDILNLGTVEEIADSVITGTCRVIGYLLVPINNKY